MSDAYWIICDELNRCRDAKTDVIYEAGLQRALDLLRNTAWEKKKVDGPDDRL
jgi:hypothetical protein